MSYLRLNIFVPALDILSRAGVRQAYAQALATEIGLAREDLASYDIIAVSIINADRLTDWNLSHVFATLGRSADVGAAFRVATIAPERVSTGVIAALRNFHVHIYDIDLGSLDAVEFHALRRPYAFETYRLLERFLDEYDMRNWRAGITVGMRGQTQGSCRRSLDRLVSWGPQAVRVHIGDAPVEEACERLVQAERVLLDAGYFRTGLLDYSLPCASLGGMPLHGEDDASEYWGFGLGARSLVNGCLVCNVADLGTYLDGAGAALPRVVRLDRMTLARADTQRALASSAGLDWAWLRATYAEECRDVAPWLDSLCRRGLALRDGDIVRLTRKGAVMSRALWKELDEAGGMVGCGDEMRVIAAADA